MLKQTKAKLKKVIRLEMRRLLELYALEPFDAKEAERSMRIIKAAVETLIKVSTAAFIIRMLLSASFASKGSNA